MKWGSLLFGAQALLVVEGGHNHPDWIAALADHERWKAARAATACGVFMRKAGPFACPRFQLHQTVCS